MLMPLGRALWCATVTLDQLPQRSRAAVVAGLGAGGQYRLQLFDRAFVALIPWADERAQQN